MKLKTKKQKRPALCAICGHESHYKFYNAQCCEACKQFFRRAVKEQREYRCWKKGLCMVKDFKCQSCRLDQCLLAGMLFEKVRVDNTELAHRYALQLMLRKKRAMLLRSGQIQSGDGECAIASGSNSRSPSEVIQNLLHNADFCLTNSDFGTSADQDIDLPEVAFPSMELAYSLPSISDPSDRTLIDLSIIEGNVERFLANERSFKDGFLEQFDCIQKLVSCPPGIIRNFEQFTEPGLNYFDEQKVLRNGFFASKHNNLLMDLLTAVDLCRTMPFFAKLDIDDQARLATYLGVPLIELITRYECSRKNFTTVVKLNGCQPIRLFCSKDGWYSGDKTIYQLAYQLFFLAMEAFNQIKLSREEYLLLRAIVIAHPSTPGLSQQASALLEAESDRYCGHLMRHVQREYGPAVGARRFADIVRLAEYVFRSAQKHREFTTYLAMVPDQRRFHNEMPGCFIPMFLGGD